MLTILSHNESKTVGLVDGDNPESHQICEFDPLALKEWVEQIVEHFGPDKPVFVSVHPSAVVNVKALAASDSLGDTLQVMVVGWEKKK
jgi:hypothetical protein